jgi:hypothetical protein
MAFNSRNRGAAMTKEQLIKARDEFEGAHLDADLSNPTQDIIRALINNALDEPIEGLAEAIDDHARNGVMRCSYESIVKIVEAARRQLNQGGGGVE